MRQQIQILLFTLIVVTAIAFSTAYADGPTSAILEPSQNAHYSLPAGKRAKITDFKLYLEGVEHTERTNPGSGFAKAAAPTKIQIGFFTVNNRSITPNVGELVIDGPSELHIHPIAPSLSGQVFGAQYYRTLADSAPASQTPYVAITIDAIPNNATTSITPTNTVVIPENASGSVRVILESSIDLVNWTEALPGVYSSSTNKRFFRLRAVSE